MAAVRIGLVGAGFMGKIHSIAYRNAGMLFGGEIPSVDAVAVTDFDPALADRAVADWGWSRSVRSWQEITTADVDVVDICTPNDNHVDIALDALQRGKHVLCEKPLALDADSCYRLCEAAAASDRVAQVGFVYRQWPAVAMARQLIDEGAIGNVRTARAQFLLDYNGNPDVPMSWRFDKVRAGSGALGDVGSHCIDLLQYLAGPISVVAAARMQRFVDQRRGFDGNLADVTVDDQTEVLADFESGATGTILASWAGTGHKCDLGFEVIGSRGSVAFSWQRSNELQFFDGTDPQDRQGYRTIFVGPAHPGADGIHTVAAQGLGYTDAFTIAARNTLRNIAAGKVLSGPTFVDGLRVAEVTDAVIAAVESGSSAAVIRRTI